MLRSVLLMVSRVLASLELLGRESREVLMPSRTFAASCDMAWDHKRWKSSLNSLSEELSMLVDSICNDHGWREM